MTARFRINKNKFMTNIRISLVAILMVFILFACKKGDNFNPDAQYTINGTVLKQDSTSTNPGTHIVQDFFIESSTIDLDDYNNRSATVFGNEIDGNSKHLKIIEVKE